VASLVLGSVERITLQHDTSPTRENDETVWQLIWIMDGQQTISRWAIDHSTIQQHTLFIKEKFYHQQHSIIRTNSGCSLKRTHSGDGNICKLSLCRNGILGTRQRHKLVDIKA